MDAAVKDCEKASSIETTKCVAEVGTAESVDSVSIATKEAIPRQPPDGGHAWLIVFGCFCGLLATQGFGFAQGIFLNYYNIHVFPNQMTSLSWISSLWLAINTIVGPLFGYLSVKIGYRWILFAGAMCCTLGLMLASVATEIWHLYLTQGVLSGLGSSLIWFPCITAPQQWFSKRRGLGVGLSIAGSGCGGLVFSNVTQAALNAFGYRWAMRIDGFITLCLLIVAAIIVRPLNRHSNKDTKLLHFSVFRNFRFDILFIIQIITNFSFNVPSVFLPSYANYIGLSPWVGSNITAILAGLMVVGKITSGFASDHLGRANVTFICIIMTGVSCLIFWLPAHSAGMLWTFAIMFGYFGGGYMTMIPAVLAQTVTTQELEPSNGFLFFGWFFGGLFGSPIASVLIDENGPNGPQYSHAIIYGGVLTIFSGLLALVLRISLGGIHPFRKV